MRISEAPAVDVRGPLTAQRRRLLSRLTSLSDAQWAAPTAAPQWPVKGIALHLLDVDLSWLAHDRDHDQAGIIPVPSDHEEFVCGLAPATWLAHAPSTGPGRRRCGSTA